MKETLAIICLSIKQTFKFGMFWMQNVKVCYNTNVFVVCMWRMNALIFSTRRWAELSMTGGVDVISWPIFRNGDNSHHLKEKFFRVVAVAHFFLALNRVSACNKNMAG